MVHGGAVNFDYNFFNHGWVKKLVDRGAMVIGMDLRGHGKSEKPHEISHYGTSNLANDIIGLLNHLNLDAVSIVGYSLGSAIVLHLLQLAPKRFIKAALVATGDGLIGVSEKTFEKILPKLVEALSHSEYPADLPKYISAYWNFANETGSDRKTISKMAQGTYPFIPIAEAQKINIPTLIISGELDPVLGTGSVLAKTLPNAEYTEIRSANHFSLAIDPTVQELVANFIL